MLFSGGFQMFYSFEGVVIPIPHMDFLLHETLAATLFPCACSLDDFCLPVKGYAYLSRVCLFVKIIGISRGSPNLPGRNPG